MARHLDGPNRDINKDCGYPQGAISLEEIQAMYTREGIASRIVGIMPQETWAVDPEFCENEDESVVTPFEEALEEFIENSNMLHYWERADVESGVGHFGVLFLGVNDGQDPTKPLKGIDDKGGMVVKKPKPKKSMASRIIGDDEDDADTKTDTGNDEPGTPTTEPVEQELVPYSYTRVLSESFVTIGSTETDPNNPRYGQPKTYNLTLGQSTVRSNDGGVAAGSGTSGPVQLVGVHWTRIIHIADNRKSSEIFGTPRLEAVYNRLCDLRKLLGGSAEMFWKGGFPGVSFEMDPRIAAQDATMDPIAVRKEWTNYVNGLDRLIATEGLHANQLTVQVADPEAHFRIQVQAICIAMGIPLRIFMGSEAAELASSQDSKSWNRRVGRRQNRYVTPCIIRPTIDRLIACGVLPVPDESYKVKWPDLNTPTDLDKAAVAAQLTQAIATYMTSGAEAILPVLDFLTKIIGLSTEDAKAIIKAVDDRDDDLYTDTEDPEAEQAQLDDQHNKTKELKQMEIDAQEKLAKTTQKAPGK